MADGAKKTYLVHHIVLNTFVGTAPPGQECRHLDGRPENNSLANLQWSSSLVNNRDKNVHGTMARGETHGRAKLTDEKVRAMRLEMHAGMTFQAAGEKYDVDHITAERVYRGKLWKHIPLEYTPVSRRVGGRSPAIASEVVRACRKLDAEKIPYVEIACRVGLGRSQVRDICLRKTYKHIE
jgi:hypothetical protein